MKMHNRAKLKKIGVAIAVLLVVLVILAGVFVWLREKNDLSFQTESKCSDYPGGLPVWPDNLTTFTGNSYGVVIGTILNYDTYAMSSNGDNWSLRLRVTDVMKGDALHKGDILQLCGTTGPIRFAGDNRTVLVFLDGKNHDIWVPLQGYIGIIPQSKDGHFKQRWDDGSVTSATIAELQTLIK